MNAPRRNASRRARSHDAPGALDLLEEAAFLLRRLPAATMACYLAGTIPMLLGALYFFATLTNGIRGHSDAAEASLLMVALFAWMKTAQAIAAEQALAVLEQRPPAELRWRDWVAIGARQLRLHAYGLVAIPLALTLIVPAGWVFAFFQNGTALGVSAGRQTIPLSWTQARLWPLQNHLGLLVLSLLGLFVFVNVSLAIYLVPYLARVLFGFDTLFATSGWSPFNTTFMATAFAFTYLAVDPLCKAQYVLRCFYGHARHTGIDLVVRARAALTSPLAALLVAALLMVAVNGRQSLSAADVEAASAPMATPAAVVDAGELDGALDDVLADPDYDWRLRDAPGEEEDQGLVGHFIDSVRGVIKSVMDAFGRFIEWLTHREESSRAPRDISGIGMVFDLLVPVVIGLVIIALLWFAWRWWAGNREPEATPSAPVTVATEVVADESVTADQLPEDEWLRLARELLAKGEFRLALRAFFLSSLAALAQRGLLVLARHKSNRDYERELARRGGGAGLANVFAENRRVLEQAWYGRAPATLDDVQRFEANVSALWGGET